MSFLADLLAQLNWGALVFLAPIPVVLRAATLATVAARLSERNAP
ncbi:hypothetical protein [Shimia sp. Alg240-R146]|nr:hypothetical protein [Shimia sp. Alg240-R146]